MRGAIGTLVVNIDGTSTSYSILIDYSTGVSNEIIIDITGVNNISWSLSGQQNSTHAYYTRLGNAKFINE